MLADVVQFAAAKMEQVLGKRMVIGVLCGPREGIGGYVLHGTGVTSCTSPAAMDALSSSVDGVVQALQLVASSTDLAASLDVVNVGDVDMHLDEVAPMQRVQITSEATGRLTEPVADDRAPYHITDRVVKDVTDALAVQRKERGGDNKERLVELVALYRFNVIKRTRVQYTFEKCTPEVARGATIIWWKGKKKYEVKDPRFCNSASVRVIPILSIFLLMIHLRDPAFMAILRHYKGGALADESAAARK
eukprot:contig_22015_g5433